MSHRKLLLTPSLFWNPSPAFSFCSQQHIWMWLDLQLPRPSYMCLYWIHPTPNLGRGTVSCFLPGIWDWWWFHTDKWSKSCGWISKLWAGRIPNVEQRKSHRSHSRYCMYLFSLITTVFSEMSGKIIFVLWPVWEASADRQRPEPGCGSGSASRLLLHQTRELFYNWGNNQLLGMFKHKQITRWTVQEETKWLWKSSAGRMFWVLHAYTSIYQQQLANLPQ